jgi:uncharacterized protein
MEMKLTFEKYQEGLSNNKLLGLLCEKCGTYTVPPQAVCRKCQSADLSVKEITKSGIIKTFTVIRTAAEGFNPPFIVAMVETKEKAWIVGNVIGIDPNKADMDIIGKKVEISAQSVKGDTYSNGDIWTPTFKIEA